jgi:hypothetical protein
MNVAKKLINYIHIRNNRNIAYNGIYIAYLTFKRKTFFMRQIILLLFASIINLSYGQDNWSKVSIFLPIEPTKDHKLMDVQEVKVYTLDHELKEELHLARPQKILFSLPNSIERIEMTKSNIFGKDFKVTTDINKTYYLKDDYVIYQGYTKDEVYTFVVMKSSVALFFSDAEGNHEITLSDDGLYKHTISLIRLEDFHCNVVEKHPRESNKASGDRAVNSSECVDVYFEIDNNQYNKTKGSNPSLYIQSTTDWLVSLMAQVNIQFNREGIPLKISEVKIFTNVDPYAIHNSSASVLYAFSDSMSNQGFNGSLAHLLVGRSIGGGIAFINALCSSYSNMAVSGNLNSGVVGYPSYSWNVMVVAHELGHNFGSNHTHDCVWNGNNTAIDGCQNPSNCPDIPNPPQGGTIMSYCHLQSVGINLAFGFGPQPGALIFDHFENALCDLSNDCSATPPINDLCVTNKFLPANKSCLIYHSDNNDSSPTSGLTNSQCINGANFKDVWFTSKVGSNGNLTIETKQITNGLADLVIEIFTGNCNALVFHSCDDNSGDNDHAKIIISDASLSNANIFIRVIEKLNNTGTFGICITSIDKACDTLIADDLEEFYTQLNGANWTNKNGWEDAINGNCDFCSWYGVFCNYLGKVDSIKLNDNNLSDTLLSHFEFPITLQKLDLSNNSIYGKIPPQWLDLSKIKELNLSYNLINDTLPNVYYTYKFLQKMDVSHNDISGHLPRFLGYLSSINYFDASHNDLVGCFESSLHNIENIYINLSDNAGLPMNGNLTLFFADSTGNDVDWDHYCYKMNDCNDNINTVYLGAPELCDLLDNDCDGIIDDGLPTLNQFILANGNWNDNSAWSLGHKPLLCEAVVIGSLASSSFSEISPQSGFQIKSLLINPGSEVKINSNGNISIRAGKILNKGILNNFGFISMYSDDYTIIDTAFVNHGSYTGQVNSGMFLNSFNKIGISNQNTGTILNNGNIYLNMYDTPSPMNGLVNKGLINNFGTISISGNAQNDFIKLELNSILNVKGLGKINSGNNGGSGG